MMGLTFEAPPTSVAVPVISAESVAQIGLPAGSKRLTLDSSATITSDLEKANRPPGSPVPLVSFGAQDRRTPSPATTPNALTFLSRVVCKRRWAQPSKEV